MSGYKPPVKKSAGGPQGKTKILIKDDRAKLLIEDTDGNEESFIIDLDEQSDEVRPLIQKGIWFVRLSGDKKKVYTVRPWEGLYAAKFIKFAAEKGKDPAPKKNLKYDTLYANAILEIISGNAKGMTLSYQIRYAFAPLDEDGKVVAALEGNTEWKGKITAVGKLAEFLDLIGIWEGGALPYRDNLLPVIEKRALRADKTFKVLIKQSWVESLFAADSEPEEMVDDEEE